MKEFPCMTMELTPVRMLFSSDSALPVNGANEVQPGVDDNQTREEVRRLKEIDSKVRAHEAAHRSAAGGLDRGTNYGYKKGPDGKLYAVSGEVKIDTSPVPGNPRATAAKMERVRAAALAPSDPSPQDLKVAAEAARAEQGAKQDAKEQDTTDSANPGETNAAIAYSTLSGISPQHQFDKFM